MTRPELLELRNRLLEATKRQASLGAYDANAQPILILCESCLLLAQHLLDQTRKDQRV